MNRLCKSIILCIGANWYRLVEPAGNIIPEATPGEDACAAVGKGWMNGTRPTTPRESRVVEFCISRGSNPCLAFTGKVTNCESFFTYMLPDLSGDDNRFCAESETFPGAGKPTTFTTQVRFNTEIVFKS